jgi:hypothetical protein
MSQLEALAVLQPGNQTSIVGAQTRGQRYPSSDFRLPFAPPHDIRLLDIR